MNFIKKWYTYQKERFPIATYGLYILCLSFAAFFYNTKMLEIESNVGVFITMFVVAFLQFLMVRIIDEFKDYEEDKKYRPYRPVPRGLIKLKELRTLFVICIIIQFALTLIMNPFSLIFLLVLWIMFILMTKSFFMKKLVDKHILLEVALDEILLPTLMLYLSSFIKLDITIFWRLLLLSYVVSWIIEIARKVRCKKDEEKGVKTYTAVFGIPKATILLSVLELILTILRLFLPGEPLMNVAQIGLIILFIGTIIVNVLFTQKKTRKFAKTVEYLADGLVMLTLLSTLFVI